jgi:DNA sulfur modification protein DndD
MKIRTAAFKNFKLLKSLSLDFGDNKQKPLTVIRAENASGKTSILNALRWGLFGIKGLERNDVRLSPADWPDGRPCEVQVTVEFDHTAYANVAGEVVARPTSFRMVRAVTETPSHNTFERSADRITLFELRDVGAHPVSSPDAAVDKMLPLEMKDIFFTDGDAALSFITSNGNKGARRQQVKEAIRSLLGVALLENAQRHVKAVETIFRARVADAAGSGDLKRVEAELEKENTKAENLQEQLSEAQSRVKNLERQFEEADKELIRALQEGNHAELSDRLEKAKKQRDHGRSVELKLKREQQRMFEAESLSWALLRGPLEVGAQMLTDLHDRKIIPRTTIPVLEDRMELGICICGTSLAPGSAGRDHVERLIASQRNEDDEKQRLTRLYFEARAGGDSASAEGSWLADLGSVEKNRVEIMQLQREAKKEIDWCEQRIAAIDRTEVEQRRTHRDDVRTSLKKQERQILELQMALHQAEACAASLAKDFKEMAAKTRQDAAAKARLDVATDILEVLKAALSVVQDDCIGQVSKRMNSLFLEMIGADPEVGGLFGEARISDQFDIVVKTRDLRTLDPEFDLNGASKRALTFAFVWALTEVSGVVAPRIVDTPLGMMSGAVKCRVLNLIAGPSASDAEKQVVLLLTRAEIAGTEKVLDVVTGHCLTLTNTIHYPKDLVNEPRLKQPNILRCECSYKKVCEQCARHDDATYGLSA